MFTPLLAPCTVTDPFIDSFEVVGGGYLQTSPEYAMKRLLADGAPDIYQLAPAFRAEERGRLHRPEFLLLEWYRLGYDDRRLMAEVAELVDLVLQAPAEYSFHRYADIVPMSAEPHLAYAEACERLPGRAFVTHFPASEAALARLHDDGTAARFELIVDGIEIANGYYELTDAAALRNRFVADNAERRQLGKPEVALDEAMLAATARGLPDCAGVALGIDRLAMIRQGAASLDALLPLG